MHGNRTRVMTLIKVSHVVKFLWQHDPPNEEVLSTYSFNYATLRYIMLCHTGALELYTGGLEPKTTLLSHFCED